MPSPRPGAARAPSSGPLLGAPSRRGAVGSPAFGALALVGLVALVVAGIAGYAIGASGRSSDSDAAKARRSAERQAFEAATADQTARGRSAGSQAGTRSGTVAGRRAGAGAQRASAAPPPGQVKDCPAGTVVRKNTIVSSVRGISCAAAAKEQLAALKAGKTTTTPKGFACQRIDPKHYRCTKGVLAYRWDVTQ